MSETWESEGVEVHVAGETLTREDGVTAADVKAIAKSHGIKKFRVIVNGEPAEPEDFPVGDGEVEIQEYNEAK